MFKISIDDSRLKNIEENKVYWIIMNTFLNDCDVTNKNYNYWNEAMAWAKSKDFFPNLSEDELFLILRKYDFWNEFEKEFKPLTGEN